MDATEANGGELEADGHTPERNCLNCGTPLIGDHCHACGQRAHVHRTLSGFFHDLLHGVLHFEGKIWNTLPLLAWRPGEITRRYIDGERAKFVSPIALFLFSVFLLFAVASFTGSTFGSPVAGQEIQREMTQDISKLEADVAALRAERDAAARAGRPTAGFDAQIDDQVREIAVMRGLRSGEVWSNPQFVSSDELPGWLRRPIEKAGRNPELLFYKIRTNAYKFSWALIPISVPFLWLLFPFSRRFRLYDHTVFVTYSLGFMTLLAVTGMVIGAAGMASIAGLLFLVPPFHMYRQLKGAYGLSRASALIRTILLVSFATVALTFFGLMLFALGLID